MSADISDRRLLASGAGKASVIPMPAKTGAPLPS
jgi:hypothetical protein